MTSCSISHSKPTSLTKGDAIKPGFHIVVSDGDVSQQRIGGTLTPLWKRFYSDVPDVPVMSLADVPVEIKNVELCSTFENFPMHRRRVSLMRGEFSKWKPQIFDRQRRGRPILHLEIHNNAFETQKYTIKLQKQPSDDITGTRPHFVP